MFQIRNLFWKFPLCFLFVCLLFSTLVFNKIISFLCVFFLFLNSFWVSCPVHKPFLTCPGEAEQILGALKYHGGVYHLMASSGRSSWKKYHGGVYHLKAPSGRSSRNTGPGPWGKCCWVFLRQSSGTVCQLQRSELGLPKSLLLGGPSAESSLVTIAGYQGRSEARGWGG